MNQQTTEQTNSDVLPLMLKSILCLAFMSPAHALLGPFWTLVLGLAVICILHIFSSLKLRIKENNADTKDTVDASSAIKRTEKSTRLALVSQKVNKLQPYLSHAVDLSAPYLLLAMGAFQLYNSYNLTNLWESTATLAWTCGMQALGVISVSQLAIAPRVQKYTTIAALTSWLIMMGVTAPSTDLTTLATTGRLDALILLASGIGCVRLGHSESNNHSALRNATALRVGVLSCSSLLNGLCSGRPMQLFMTILRGLQVPQLHVLNGLRVPMWALSHVLMVSAVGGTQLSNLGNKIARPEMLAMYATGTAGTVLVHLLTAAAPDTDSRVSRVLVGGAVGTLIYLIGSKRRSPKLWRILRGLGFASFCVICCTVGPAKASASTVLRPAFVPAFSGPVLPELPERLYSTTISPPTTNNYGNGVTDGDDDRYTTSTTPLYTITPDEPLDAILRRDEQSIGIFKHVAPIISKRSEGVQLNNTEITVAMRELNRIIQDKKTRPGTAADAIYLLSQVEAAAYEIAQLEGGVPTNWTSEGVAEAVGNIAQFEGGEPTNWTSEATQALPQKKDPKGACKPTPRPLRYSHSQHLSRQNNLESCQQNTVLESEEMTELFE